MRDATPNFDQDRIDELRSLYMRMVANKSAATGIEKALILGQRRTRAVVPMRSEIWLDLWGLGYSTTEIGHVVGRDHSSIVRSNQIIRRVDSNAGYCKRAREAEARRSAIMAARLDRSAAITRGRMEAADMARKAAVGAVEAAREARQAQADVERAMQSLVLDSYSAEVTAVQAAGERENVVTELMFAARALRGKERYEAVVRAMLTLDEEMAQRLWADYCRSAFPHSMAANIANPPRAWAMRMQEAA